MGRWLIPFFLFGGAVATGASYPATVTAASSPPGILAADFHVHTFPGDGSLPPWTMAREAARRGLDAIALTNHNVLWPWQLTMALDRSGEGALLLPAVLLPAEEVTSPRFHAAAIGVTRRVDWRGRLVDVAARVHAQGGVLIVAHPDRHFRAALTPEAFRAIDGIEAAHPETEWPDLRDDVLAAYARATAAHPGIAAIGSSDTHFFAPVGVCRTFVFTASRSLDGFLDAIRAGRTVGCDAQGDVHGPAMLAAQVAGACRAAAAANARPQGTQAGWLAWLALAWLLMSDVRRPVSHGA